MLHQGNKKNLSMNETIVVSQDCHKFLGSPVTCGSQRVIKGNFWEQQTHKTKKNRLKLILAT